MRFIDNDNGTITDTKTGLMWQKAMAPEAHTWQKAMDYCKSLRLSGHGDWRLPTKDELMSLVDSKRYNPAIDSIFNAVSLWYLSSSTDVYCPDYVWSVCFLSGNVGIGSKTIGHYVRAVRNIT